MVDYFTILWTIITFAFALVYLIAKCFEFVWQTLETKKKVDYLIKKDKKNVL